MILIDDNAPRWMKELDRFIHLKSLLLIHGNILDLISYQVKSADNSYWSESQLSQFLQRLLIQYGYDIVAEFDPVDGFEFQTDEMHKSFNAVSKNKSPVLQNPMRHSKSENPDTLSAIRCMAAATSNREKTSAFIINFASRLTPAPDRLSQQEQSLFTRLLKASLDSHEVIRGDGRWNNVIILLCDKINDLPAFLYVQNPRSRSIYLDKPGTLERSRFIRNNYRSFYGSSTDHDIPEDLPIQFSNLTEGFSHYEMLSLIGLSIREQLPVSKIKLLCERFKYGVTESDWDKLDKSRLDTAGERLRQRIKGQEPAMERLLEIIRRARLGLEAGSVQKSQRPRGVLFFAGPTGVGKTEMAKGLAELLFGEEERLIRFDMSEYAQAHADQKLLGAPPGYVGYEEGGKLTNAIKQQPFSVLLFDEIEKAHGSIFDKFLQILDDGRLSDGKGETVYFSEAIIIFTSNIGTYSSNLGEDGRRQILINQKMPYTDIRDTMLEAIRIHFNQNLGRPEILNRFGENFVVFDFIRPPVDEAILKQLLQRLEKALQEQHGVKLSIQDSALNTLIRLGRNYLQHGGRGIRNMLDAALVNPLATVMFMESPAKGAHLLLNNIIDHGDDASHRFTLDYQLDN